MLASKNTGAVRLIGLGVTISSGSAVVITVLQMYGVIDPAQISTQTEPKEESSRRSSTSERSMNDRASVSIVCSEFLSTYDARLLLGNAISAFLSRGTKRPRA